MRRKGFVVAGLVVLLVVAGAVVSAVDGRDDEVAVGDKGVSSSAGAPVLGGSSGSGESGRVGATEPAGGLAADTAVAPSASPGLAQTVAPTGPRVVRNADMSVKVDEGRFGAAFDRVSAIATSYGGYVTSSGTAAGEDGGRAVSGQLTLRVPVDRFEDARRALGELGEVERESQRGEDVSGQLVDYDARLRSLKAQEESLQGLLGRATNVGEVMQVQSSLFGVRQQIEQLEGQRAQLDQAAALATIQVSLYEPGAGFLLDPEPEPATGLADAFERAVDGAVSVLGGMIVVVGWLTPVAALLLLGWLVARLRRRPAAPVAPAAPATP